MAKGKIKLSGGGELVLLANAATKYRFRQIFGLDLMEEYETLADKSLGEQVETIEKLAYTMALQAQKKADEGTIDNFLTWLEEMDPDDLALRMNEIVMIYNNQQKTLSERKNPEGPQNEE